MIYKMSLTHLLNPNTYGGFPPSPTGWNPVGPNNLEWANLNCDSITLNGFTANNVNVDTLTVSDYMEVLSASNQIKLGDPTKPMIINAQPTSSDRIYSLIDSGANADFILSRGSQILSGAKTFSNLADFTADVQVGFTQKMISGKSLVQGILIDNENTVDVSTFNKYLSFVRNELKLPDNTASSVLFIDIPNANVQFSITAYFMATDNLSHGSASFHKEYTITRLAGSNAIVDAGGNYGGSQSGSSCVISNLSTFTVTGGVTATNLVTIYATVDVSGGATDSNMFMRYEVSLVQLTTGTISFR
jgi:hypothetical protein